MEIIRNKKYQSLLTGFFAGATLLSIVVVDWIFVKITKREGIYFKCGVNKNEMSIL